jgi:hypothetical protein
MNSSIISVKMQGGLGNMMFQAAFAMAFSFEKNCSYELLHFNENCQANKQWLNRDSDHYSNFVFQRFDLQPKFGDVQVHPESVFHFSDQPFIEGKRNIYTGYFQSEKYFYNFKDQVKAMFTPNPQTLEYIHGKYQFLGDMNSIHIRRGDYLHQQGNHPVITLDYLNKGIEYLGRNEKYLIFSDDINWCKNNLNLKNAFFVENELDYISLFMMSLCKNHILSNSSFSWWGAWLNKDNQKTIIRPRHWFGPNYSNLNTSDMCPEDWVVFDV